MKIGIAANRQKSEVAILNREEEENEAVISSTPVFELRARRRPWRHINRPEVGNLHVRRLKQTNFYQNLDMRWHFSFLQPTAHTKSEARPAIMREVLVEF